MKFLPVVLLLLPTPALAAEYWAEPDISLKSGYNDNIRLATGPHDSVWENDLAIGSRFGVAQENQGVTGNAAVKIRRFSGGSGAEDSALLDREDYFFNLDGYRLTELDRFALNYDYIRDSTLDSELDESGLVADARATRIRNTLGASWARILTEKTQLSVDYRHNDVDFVDDPGINDLIPFKSNILNASLGYQWRPRTQIILGAGGSLFEPETGFNSNTINAQAGINHAFTETIRATFLAGQRRTVSDSLFATGFCIGADPGASFPECRGGIPVVTGTTRGETTTTGPTYNVSVTKTLATGSVTASATRSTQPGLNGQLLDRNRFLLQGDRRLTERWRSSLRIEYTENETIVNVFGREADQRKETFFRVTPRVSWRWTNEWSISGEYQYARNITRLDRTATRNAAYLTLSYQPTRLSLSR